MRRRRASARLARSPPCRTTGVGALPSGTMTGLPPPRPPTLASLGVFPRRALTTAQIYGIECRMLKTQKITAHVPVKSLHRARAATGKGITDTVRLGLDLLASTKAADELRRLRGKVRLDLDLAELRRDRR